MSKAVVFLAEGFEEVEGLTVVDLLRRAGFELFTVAVGNENEVTGAHCITVMADVTFGKMSFNDVDLLVLPGGMPGTLNLAAHDGVTGLLKDFYNKGKKIAAICAAPSVFGGLGLLEGKKATCYPGFEEKLTGANYVAEPVVIDGNITTSRGVGTAIPFALSLIAQFFGEEKAMEIKNGIVF